MELDAQEALRAEEERKKQKPVLDAEGAAAVAASLYGLAVVPGSIKDLDSYDDRNFYFKATADRPEWLSASDENGAGDGAAHFVLKVHNGVESAEPSFIEAQNEAMGRVRAGGGVWCPRALPSLAGLPIARHGVPTAESDGAPRNLALRCLPFRPGRLLGDVREPSAALLAQLGATAARVSASLETFSHPATRRPTFIWDLAHAHGVRTLLLHLPAERRPTVAGVLDEFEARVLPRAHELRAQVIHNDLNDQNVLVDEAGAEVVGLLDFGDLCHSWLVNELAISIAYVAIARFYGSTDAARPGPDEAAAMRRDIEAVTAGFEAARPLNEAERAVLPTLVAGRVAVSLTLGAYSSSLDPSNEYLKMTLLPGWRALQLLRD